MAEKKLTDQNVSEIDKALAAAKARKEAKGSGTAGDKPAKAEKTASEPKEPKRPKLTDEEKAARTAAREAQRAERKAARDAARAAKIAERNANRKPAHMKKVEKAAEKLGTLPAAAQLLFNEAITNLPAAELASLALHFQHYNRVQATQRALNQKIEAGVEVTIISGDPRWIGKTGTVTKAQRIRCYVQIEGVAKPVYLFTSDVTPVAAVEQAATATG